MNTFLSEVMEPLNQAGLQPSKLEPPLKNKTSSDKPNNVSIAQPNFTSSLFIGAGNYPGNSLSATGVFLSGGTIQGPNPFKSTVPQNFQNNVEQQTFTHVVSSESEKSSLLSNLADVSGHYGNIEGSASLSFANQINITQTSLNVFKYAYISLGNMVFDFSNQELSDNVVNLLDPTLEHNKNPNDYLSNIKSFLSVYGYYYISSYQLYGELLASWQITTISKKNKQDISSDISGKITGGSFDFSAVNKFISEVSSSFSQTSSTYRSIGIGVDKNIQTVDQLNNVFNNFLDSMSQKTAKISKIFIAPWISLTQVANYISKISDPQLQKKVSALLNGPNLTQDVWNRVLMLQNGMLSLRSRMQNSLDDPYNFDFWGFLMDYKDLPLDKIRNFIKQINTLLDKLNNLDEKIFTAAFLEFQKTDQSIWEKIQKDYLDITTIPTYSYFVQTGYFDGDIKGPMSGYFIVQGTTAIGTFDPSSTQVNTAVYTGPSLYRPYFFASAWQQGVMSFVKTNQVDKTKNPFSIVLECRLAWTGHLDWDPKTEKMIFLPNQKETFGLAVYDTTLVSAPLRGLIATRFTKNS